MHNSYTGCMESSLRPLAPRSSNPNMLQRFSHGSTQPFPMRRVCSEICNMTQKKSFYKSILTSSTKNSTGDISVKE